ncbi:hypothetical protein SAMN05421690_10852 [Nitrosomonas sp. Nm51]|nr:hypothetical protein SAMN05421690_10852 [Nitrosomonas sp. Nm51]
MWSGDLNEIFSIMKENGEVSLIADDVQYDDVKDFIQNSDGRMPVRMSIVTTNPYIEIELSSRESSLYASSSSIEATGFFTKIDRVLSRCECKPKVFYKIIWVMAISLSLTYIPDDLIFEHLISNDLGLIYLVGKGLLGLVVIIWLIYVVIINLKFHSRVHLISKNMKKNFFREHIKIIGTSVISIVIGGIITHYLQNYL